MPRFPLGSARTKQTGATSWTWVFLIAVIALAVIAGSLESGGYFDRVSKERRLIAAGNKMTEAIQSYYVQSPGTVKQLPRSIGDLVLDPRFLGDKKHLQVIEIDPMTEKQEWDEIKSDKGELIGVRSQSREIPTIISNLLAPPGSGGAAPRVACLKVHLALGQWLASGYPADVGSWANVFLIFHSSSTTKLNNEHHTIVAIRPNREI